MIKQSSVTIINKLGLHARAAAKLVQLASQFQSDITLIKAQQTANAKDMLSLLMLAAGCGTSLTIKTQGKDAISALETVQALIDNKFGEQE